MRITENEGKTTFYLEGRIDTNNAPQVEKEIFDAIEGKTSDIVIDAEKLEYISSAGLRVLMKLRKSIDKQLPVINVSRDVYDIFETTGFVRSYFCAGSDNSRSVTGYETADIRLLRQRA